MVGSVDFLVSAWARLKSSPGFADEYESTTSDTRRPSAVNSSNNDKLFPLKKNLGPKAWKFTIARVTVQFTEVPANEKKHWVHHIRRARSA
jgi:hypothetical protein